MKKIRLNDGTAIYCIKRNEAFVLQQHIYGYLKNCSEFKESDTIIDVGANIGLLGLTLSKKYKNIKIHAFEPMPDIFSVLKKMYKSVQIVIIKYTLLGFPTKIKTWYSHITQTVPHCLLQIQKYGIVIS